jgi:hypothetical protein
MPRLVAFAEVPLSTHLIQEKNIALCIVLNTSTCLSVLCTQVFQPGKKKTKSKSIPVTGRGGP